MPIPTFLATFDGSLAYRDRSGVGTLTSSGPVRYEPGLGPASQAYVAEDATTNVLLNPLAGTDTSNALALSSATVVRDTTSYKHGRTSFRVTTPGVAATEGVALNSGSGLGLTGSARTYTASIWIQGSGTIAGHLRIFYTDATSEVGSEVVVAAPADWTDDANIVCSIVANPAKTIDFVRLYVRPAPAQAVTFRVQAQVEEKDYATSFCPQIDESGNLLPGYTWAATAHASASTRAQSRCEHPGPILDNTEGEVAIRFFAGGNTARTQRAFAHSGSNNSRLYIDNNSTGRLSAGFGNPVLNLTDWDGGEVPSGELVTAFVSWDGDTARLFRDTRLAASGAYAGFDTSGSVQIGAQGSSAPLNGGVDALLIVNRPLTTAERAALVNAESWRWSSLIPTPGGVLRVGSGGAPFGVMCVGYGEGD